jgi:PAS domain S-box-containing protein
MVNKNQKDKEKLKQPQKKGRSKLKDRMPEDVYLEKLSENDLRKLVEESQIHQFELEMQNEELLRIRTELEKNMEKYSNLYDFAPVGYLTLNSDGTIREANLTAAAMMSMNRKDMIGASIYRYFVTEDRKLLSAHFKKALETSESLSCEVRLAAPDNKTQQLYVKLDTKCYLETPKNWFCRTTLTDITDRKKAESALFRSEKRLRFLSSKLLENQENERERIAYDLHDDICQMLVAGKLNAQNLMQKFPSCSPEYKALANLIDINQKIVTHIKQIVSDLRPTVLNGLGVIATIGWLCTEYKNIKPDLMIKRKIFLEEGDIPKSLKSVIFRIVQEAMSNIVTHSQADQVEIRLEKNSDIIELIIRDNGKGFELGDILFKENHKNGIGITIMTERARSSGGNLEIDASGNKGTTVIARWPLEIKTDNLMTL